MIVFNQNKQRSFTIKNFIYNSNSNLKELK